LLASYKFLLLEVFSVQIPAGFDGLNVLCGARLCVVCGVSYQTFLCSPCSYVLQWALFQWTTK